MRIVLFIAAALPLSGCITSRQGLLERSPFEYGFSARAIDDVARCLVESNRAGERIPTITGDDASKVVVFSTAEAGASVSYTLRKTAAGTEVEVRRKTGLVNKLGGQRTCYEVRA